MAARAPDTDLRQSVTSPSITQYAMLGQMTYDPLVSRIGVVMPFPGEIRWNASSRLLSRPPGTLSSTRGGGMGRGFAFRRSDRFSLGVGILPSREWLRPRSALVPRCLKPGNRDSARETREPERGWTAMSWTESIADKSLSCLLFSSSLTCLADAKWTRMPACDS